MGDVPTFDDWAAGEKPTAEKMTTNIRDAGNFFRLPPLCVLRRNTDLALVAATTTAVPWQTVDVDNDGMFDAGNPTRITAMTPGWYQLTGAAVFEPHATGFRQAEYRRNGLDVFSGIVALSAGASPHSILPFVGMVRLEAADYVEAIVYQNSGGALDLRAVNNSPRFELKWVAA